MAIAKISKGKPIRRKAGRVNVRGWSLHNAYSPSWEKLHKLIDEALNKIPQEFNDAVRRSASEALDLAIKDRDMMTGLKYPSCEIQLWLPMDEFSYSHDGPRFDIDLPELIRWELRSTENAAELRPHIIAMLERCLEIARTTEPADF